ncbi:MAG: nicotinate-nucleotide--dimethylbenzimidazole phosphoribosyltransferase [Proteobacteria bacterium]|nr:nicotinate-nucleotide--dimethylbenzimidazole phosphoribosyltransferase [Pseudomonadota bacterium]
MIKLIEYIKRIAPTDKGLEKKAFERIDNLTKPVGSLGRLEEISAKLYSIYNGNMPERLNKAVYVFSGDHGVTQRGVSAYPKDVTYQMVYNFLRGGAGICVFSRLVGADVFVVDVGVDYDFPKDEKIIHRKIRKGTRDFTEGPAMSFDDAINSVFVGIECGEDAIKRGYNLLIPGDMGIGNTTASSAIIKVFTGEDTINVVGRGTGIDDKTYENKIKIVERAIEINNPDMKNALDILEKVGGLEIGAICGFILSGAVNRVPVIIDGFICSAGFVLAYLLCPYIKDFVFFSHQSVEPGHKKILEYFNEKPLLDLNMRLGEGTGAVLASNIIEASLRMFNEMATFEEASVSRELK